MKGKLVFILLCFFQVLLAGDFEFKASVNADKIGIDDVLIYTVTYKGIQDPPRPDISIIKNFRIAQSSRSTEFRFVNGVSSYFTNFEFYLIPLKTGTLIIPPISYNHQGQQYSTQPFGIEVVKSSKGSTPPPKRRRSVFDEDFFSSPFDRKTKEKVDVKLDAWISERNILKGQQVLFKVLLYTRNRIESINLVSNQSFPGFWQEWFPVPRSIDGKTVEKDGKTYQLYEIRKVALFPTRSGSLSIPSLTFELSLVDQTFSFFSSPRKLIKKSPALIINVSELPPGVRNLPVGEFSFNIGSTKSNLDINDILTLKMRIQGQGNLKTLIIPEFKSSEFYKTYPAKISRNYDYSGSRFSGTLTAEIPVAFKSTGLMTLPELVFKSYNPSLKKVMALNSRPIKITVTGTKEKIETSMTIPSTEIMKKGEDIDFIAKGKISNENRLFYQQGIFAFLFILPFGLNLLVILKKSVLDRILLQNRTLNKKLLLNTTAKKLKNVNDYGEIHVVIEKYLQKKSGLSYSELNQYNIESFFKKHKITDYDIEAFNRIKAQSESARFSPQKQSQKNIEKDVRLMISILKRIDKRIK